MIQGVIAYPMCIPWASLRSRSSASALLSVYSRAYSVSSAGSSSISAATAVMLPTTLSRPTARSLSTWQLSSLACACTRRALSVSSHTARSASQPVWKGRLLLSSVPQQLKSWFPTFDPAVPDRSLWYSSARSVLFSAPVLSLLSLTAPTVG